MALKGISSCYDLLSGLVWCAGRNGTFLTLSANQHITHKIQDLNKKNTEKILKREEIKGERERERENKTWIITMNLPTPPPSHPMLQQSAVLTMGLLNTDTHTQPKQQHKPNKPQECPSKAPLNAWVAFKDVCLLCSRIRITWVS